MKLCMVLGNYSKTTDTLGQWLSYNPAGLCTVPWFGLCIFRAAVNGSVRCRTAWEVDLHALSLTTDLSHNAEPFSLMASQHISTYMWQSDDVIFFVIYFHHMWMFSLIFIQTSTAPEVEFHHWKVIISLVLYKIVEKSYYFLKFCWEKGLQGSKKKHPTKFFAWPAWSLCTGKCKHAFCLNVVFCYMCEHVITRLDICVLALN